MTFVLAMALSSCFFFHSHLVSCDLFHDSFRFFASLSSIWVSAFFLYFTSSRLFSLRRSEFFQVCRLFQNLANSQYTFFVVNATLPSNKRHDFHPRCNSRLCGSGGSYPPPFLRQPAFTISLLYPNSLAITIRAS